MFSSMPHTVLLGGEQALADVRVRNAALGFRSAGWRVTLVHPVARKPVSRELIPGVHLIQVRTTVRGQPRAAPELQAARQELNAQSRAVRLAQLEQAGRRAALPRLGHSVLSGARRIGDVWSRSVGSVRVLRLPDEVVTLELELQKSLVGLAPALIVVLDRVGLRAAWHASARRRLEGASCPVVYDAGSEDEGSGHDSWALDRLERKLAPHCRKLPSLPLRMPLDPAETHSPLLIASSEDDQVDPPLLVGVCTGRPHWRWCTLTTIVGALERVEGLHAALLVDADDLAGLRRRIQGAAVAARLHVAALPDADKLPTLLVGATLVVHLDEPAQHTRPSASALAAIQARVPLIVSAATADAELVYRLGVGVSVAGDEPEELSHAVSLVLEGHYRFGAAYARGDAECLRWRASMRRLESAADELRPRTALNDGAASAKADGGSDSQLRLAIGPRNGNGQAWAWAKALEEAAPDVATEVFARRFSTEDKLGMAFPADVPISVQDWKSTSWSAWWARHVLRDFSHVLLETGLTGCGGLYGSYFYDELPVLRRQGIRVGLIFRGSEIRNPRAHAARHPHSPFRDPEDPLTARLQTLSDKLRAELERLAPPLFVTTLDLIDDLPSATWLPHVIDRYLWRPGRPVFERSVPRVLHAPSREQMKGTRWVDEACQPLADRGLIEYIRLSGVPYEQMPARIRDADIVIDQLALGSYGVLALQGLSSERLVVGHVADHVRARVPGPLPIVEAAPEGLAEVLDELLSDRSSHQDLAAEGRRYVERCHSGRLSAERIAQFLGLATPVAATSTTRRRGPGHTEA